MFGIGLGELILILIVGLVLFGAEGLQEVAKVAGKLLKEFRKIQASVQETLDEVDLESTKKPADKKVETNPETKVETESKVATVSTYQPPTQESVRAELEKVAGKNFSVNTEEKSTSVENISETHSDNISETRSEKNFETRSENISEEKISLQKREA